MALSTLSLLSASLRPTQDTTEVPIQYHQQALIFFFRFRGKPKDWEEGGLTAETLFHNIHPAPGKDQQIPPYTPLVSMGQVDSLYPHLAWRRLNKAVHVDILSYPTPALWKQEGSFDSPIRWLWQGQQEANLSSSAWQIRRCSNSPTRVVSVVSSCKINLHPHLAAVRLTSGARRG